MPRVLKSNREKSWLLTLLISLQMLSVFTCLNCVRIATTPGEILDTSGRSYAFAEIKKEQSFRVERFTLPR